MLHKKEKIHSNKMYVITKSLVLVSCAWLLIIDILYIGFFFIQCHVAKNSIIHSVARTHHDLCTCLVKVLVMFR